MSKIPEHGETGVVRVQRVVVAPDGTAYTNRSAFERHRIQTDAGRARTKLSIRRAGASMTTTNHAEERRGMSEIPADVMKAARSAAKEAMLRDMHSGEAHPEIAIARAILAERERCAKIAEAAIRVGTHGGSAQFAVGVAQAIREPQP